MLNKDRLIRHYVQQSKGRSLWRRLVRAMGCMVVFCTVYALILPAITAEQPYVCGLENHAHSDLCIAGPKSGTLLCTPETLGVHTHSSGCYDESGALQCGQADCLLHTHDEYCVGTDGELLCQLPQVPEHRHSASCFGGDVLICGTEELYVHTHDAGCLDENGSLICPVTAVSAHRHGEACPVLAPDNVVFGCGMQEHTHSDACLPTQETPLTPFNAATAPMETTAPAETTLPADPPETTSSAESADPAETPILNADAQTGPMSPLAELPKLTSSLASGSATPRAGYPTAVKTGNSNAKTLYFYNFEATSTAVRPLAGCVFEIRSSDGSYVRRITSGNTLEIELPSDIGVGDYTITQVSAPDGYLRDDDYRRSFSVGISETLGGQKVFKHHTIGSFMNHSLEDVDTSKTAEVENYNNRTYEIVLSAGASVKLYDMEPIDVLFVVDQSNSMLFPAGLNPTGKRVRLHQDNGFYNNWNISQANLDRNQIYYIIADPQGTSTVFAIWHNGTSWMYQDASYYAKAFYNNAEGYRQDNEIAAFPRAGQGFQGSWTEYGNNYKANGGDLGYDLGGTLGNYLGDGGSVEFQLYTAANEYNRLHYLEESITQAVYQLSDANVENTVTVIRFTKEVNESHCMGPLEMTPENANIVVDAVNKIQTNGGTRQDLALEHAYNHLTGNVSTNDGGWGDHYTKGKDHTFTILITDGAPVRSGSSAPALDTIYQQIRNNGARVRQESTLITIGLGMDAVEGGKQVLEDIASEPHSMYANMLEDASGLTNLLHELIFSSMTPKQHPAVPGTITDVISDSFYPIAWLPKGRGGVSGRQLLFSDDRDWVILEPGDWIDVNGQYVGTTAGRTGEGQLVSQDGELVVQWKNRQLKGNPSWTGRFFVKAKEDFIGGNAIETNKRADVEVRSTDNNTVLANIELPTPTVNVRLLELNRLNSEVTVFLGDTINAQADSPRDSLNYFYHNTRFSKLIPDFRDSGGVDYGPILNAIDSDIAGDGLEAGTFTLGYAMGTDLTDAQWERLLASEENAVYVDYTYDDASSHGPVGYFTFRLTKEGETADYSSHSAAVAGEHVEEYVLHVTYTAYELGESSLLDTSKQRPDGTVHNGAAGPGTEVADENGGGRLEAGYGIVDKDNVHIVNVLCGAIEVTKEITPELVSNTDQTFRFTLHRSEDGDNHEGDRLLEITIPAGQTTGTVRTEKNLPRGTWVLTEEASDVFNIRELTIQDSTDCYAVNESTAAVFHIGDDTGDKNVIGKREGDRYTSYTGAPEGVFGAAKVVNEKTIYYGEIPVEKLWSDGQETHDSMPVYMVLYRSVNDEDQLILDTNGHAQILCLDAANNWKGFFRVALPEKGADPAAQGYFVREVGGVSPTPSDASRSAVLQNDGTTVLYYTQTAENEELIRIGKNWYMVMYEMDPATGGTTVTNHIAVTLPSTGGTGTKPYTISGLLLVAAALILGYSHLRRRERGVAC